MVCTPENEKLLIEIIELLIPGKHISSITFVNKEMHGLVIEEKNVNFDMLTERPKGFDDPMLGRLFTAAELANLTVKQRQNYDNAMFTELDRIAQINFAKKAGIDEGRMEGRKEQTLVIVRNLLQQGIEVEKIVTATGLSKEEVLALK